MHRALLACSSLRYVNDEPTSRLNPCGEMAYISGRVVGNHSTSCCGKFKPVLGETTFIGHNACYCLWRTLPPLSLPVVGFQLIYLFAAIREPPTTDRLLPRDLSKCSCQTPWCITLFRSLHRLLYAIFIIARLDRTLCGTRPSISSIPH